MIVGLESLSRELIAWAGSPAERAVNVVSVPYRGTAPLEGVLNTVLGQGRVLYITGPAFPEESVEEFLKIEQIPFSKGEDPSSPVVILDYDRAFMIKDRYDLVIYDDLNSFPTHRRAEMQELLNHIYYRTNKIIAYCVEPVFQGAKTFELPLKKDRSFVTEPRFIDTRSDLKTAVPNSIYEYIEFFFADKRSVMIFVPDHSTAEGMKHYLTRINPAFKEHLYDADELPEAELKKLAAGSSSGEIFFSRRIRDFRSVPVNFEFIVADSTLTRYDYRQFVFLCLRSGLFQQASGEVILIGPQMTPDMEKTKTLTREYNRVIWESDQLFL